MKELSLYSPLQADFFPYDETLYGEEYSNADGIPLDGDALVDYKEPIRKVVHELNERAGNLMQDFIGSESVCKKVINVTPDITVRAGELCGVAQLTLNEDLNNTEMQQLQDFLREQYADGWGERLRKRTVGLEDGVLYVHFWNNKKFQFQVFQADMPSQKENQKQRPAMQLVGHDGNIFAILGTAAQLLRRNGQDDEAQEMNKRVFAAHDYYKALDIISEYVETELSEPPKKQPEKTDKGDAR